MPRCQLLLHPFQRDPLRFRIHQHHNDKLHHHHRSKKEAVTVALEEYVQRLKQQAVFEAFGKIDYDKKFSHKRQRKAA